MNPRFITAAENASLDIIHVGVTLTNDQILALPTDGFVLVPPTETTGYATLPTQAPWPLVAVATLDLRSGNAYTNVSNDAFLTIAVGDTGDVTVLKSNFYSFLNASTGQINGQQFFPNAGVTFIDSSFQDNGLVLFTDSTLGNFTGGDPANTLTVSVYYRTVNL